MKENVVEAVKVEFNLKQKDLATMFDVSTGTISTWSTTSPTKMAQLCMEYMLKAKRAEDKLDTIAKAHKIINNLTVSNSDS